MRNKIRTIIFIGIIFFAMFQGKAIYATSASVAFSSTSKNYAVEDQFVVTVSVDAGTQISDFQTYVAYDPAKLKLVDTGNYVTGSDGLIFISDLDNGKAKSRQYRIKFKAIAEGDTEIYISDKVYIFEAGTGEEMSVSKNTLRLHIDSAGQNEEVSNEGLQSLMVSEGTLQPAFSSEITNYQLEVSADTNVLFIDAKKKLKAYGVEVEGNTNLQTGENKAQIRVTDTKGQEKVYVISIYKRSIEEEMLLKEEKKEQEAGKEKFGVAVTTKNGTVTLSTSIGLELVPLPERSLIPNGYVEDKIKVQGVSIPVYCLQDESIHDFVLVYGKTKGGEAKFYVFDRIGENIQRYKEENNVERNDYELQKEKEKVEIMFAVVFVMVVFVVILLSALLRQRGRNHRNFYDLEREYEEEL